MLVKESVKKVLTINRMKTTRRTVKYAMYKIEMSESKNIEIRKHSYRSAN